jgi:hypothetical protein
LASTVVLADAVVISALALAQQHLVPAVLIKDITTWMLPLACTSVYILQIALRPLLGLAGAAIVVIAYGLGTGHPADAWLLVVETIVAAGLVAVIRGGARQADAIVAAGLETAAACLRCGGRYSPGGGEPWSPCPAARQGLLRSLLPALGPVRTGACAMLMSAGPAAGPRWGG